MASATFQDIARKHTLTLGLDETDSPQLWAAKLKEELATKQARLKEAKPKTAPHNLLTKECRLLGEDLQVVEQEVRRLGQLQLLEELRKAVQDDDKKMFDYLVTGKTRTILPGPDEDEYKTWLSIQNLAEKKWAAPVVAAPVPPPPPNPAVAEPSPTPPLPSSRPAGEPGLDQTLRAFEAGQKVFGRYTLREVLGRGGMGVVWLARDEELKREVALKFLPEVVALDAEAVADLKRETLRGLELNHHHIVRIYDFVCDQRSAAISMEYVDGPTLSALKSRQEHGVLGVQQLTPWVEQLCAALDYAHKQACVVHRDLKPANLMINSKGELKIADFGIARALSDETTRLTAASGFSGTLPFMSPQQAAGKKSAAADDIYAVGATLYNLLTGKPPFFSGDILDQLKNETPPAIRERRRELNIAGDPVPEHWEKAIAECLCKNPAQRPASAGELWSRLQTPTKSPPAQPEPKAEVGQPVVESRPSPPPPPPVAENPPEATPNAPEKGEMEPPPQRKTLFAVLVMAAVAVLALVLLLPHHTPKTNVLETTSKFPQGGRRWTNSLGQIFAPVPGTSVLFCIWDTTVRDFEAFVSDTGYDATAGMVSIRSEGAKKWGDSWKHPGFEQAPTHPVCGVSWDDAHAFCHWLTEKERKAGLLATNQSYRLPTDSEWSAAAGSKTYPWGDQWPPRAGAGNYAGSETADADWPANVKTIEGYHDGYARTSPVGSFAPNEFGLYDMGGNVYQWCEDWFRKEMNSLETRQKIRGMGIDGGGKEFRLLRGASWSSGDPVLLASAYHAKNTPGLRNSVVGFRCVLVVDGASGLSETDAAPPSAVPEQPVKPQTAKVTVLTEPAGAMVFIDGVTDEKRTPTVMLDVPQGRHRVRVVLEGYATAESNVVVDASNPVVNFGRMAPEAPKFPQAGQRWTNSLGQIFAPVPGTSVLFCIWDTRVQDFQTFADQTGYDATAGMESLRSDGQKRRGDTWKHPGFKQGPTHPVCGVNWDDAQAFCKWLTEKEKSAGLLAANQTYRLPKDSEWSAAVGSWKYPWGDQWPPPPGAGNYAGTEVEDGNGPSASHHIEGYRDGYPRTSPVGSFAANEFGLYDMGGNVYQWCEDWFRKEMNTAETRRAIPGMENDGRGQTFRVLRGASWYAWRQEQLASAFRTKHLPGARFDFIGFRCVLDVGNRTK